MSEQIWRPLPDGEYPNGDGRLQISNGGASIALRSGAYFTSADLTHWRLCEGVSAPRIDGQWLAAPDSEGYWASEGHVEWLPLDPLQWCLMVRRNALDGNLYAHRFGGHAVPIRLMIGKWTRLHMPWVSLEVTA